MCRMLGLAGPTNLPAGRQGALATQALEAFYPLCTDGVVREDFRRQGQMGHLDGWGITGYEGGRPTDFGKQAAPPTEDRATWKKSVAAAEASKSPVILVHFRKLSVGKRLLQNTHPFQNGQWIFCHNGTVYDHEKLKLKRLDPIGTTDSEHLFLYIVEALDGVPPPDRAAKLKEVLAHVQKTCSFTSLTLLLSDGLTLYAYRNYTDQHLGPGETAATREKYYTLWTAEAEGVRLVCSEPILKGKNLSWTPLANNELAVFSTQPPEAR